MKNVALVNEGHVRAGARQRLLSDSLPYPEFKEQVEAWIPCIVPTLALPRTVTGSVLKDTVYPYLGRDEAGKDLYLTVKRDKDGRIVERKANKATTMWKDGQGGCRKYDEMCALDAVFDSSAGKRGLLHRHPEARSRNRDHEGVFQGEGDRHVGYRRGARGRAAPDDQARRRARVRREGREVPFV